MPINTSGFTVQEMPRYQPVDPGLAALNPASIAHGVLTGLQIGGTIDELKAFKQHAKEIADTEGIRTQLLKAQSDQQQVLAQNALARQQSENAAAIEEAKKNAKLAPLQGESQAQTIQAGLPNIAPAAKVQGGALENILAGQSFEKTQLPTTQATTSISNAAALNAAPELAIAKKTQADADYQTAVLNLAKAKDEVASLPEDKRRHDALIEAQTTTQIALANKDNADAELARQKPSMAQAREAARVQAAQMHTNNYQLLSQDFSRQSTALKNLEATHVVNPADPNDDKFTAGQLADALAADQGRGAISQFFNASKAITPDQKLTIKRIQDQRARVDALAEGLNHVSQQVLGLYGKDQATVPEAAQEGSVKPIDGFPGTEQTFINGKWIRTK